MKSQKKTCSKGSVDRSKPATLKEKVRQWKEWLSGDDIFSIRNQIIHMLWDDEIFRVLNECARLQEDSAADDAQINGYVWEFIFNNYFCSQALQIRRLIQKQTQNEDRRVISLQALLDDMSANRNLLTRGSLFEALEYDYDYEPIKAADEQYRYVEAPQVPGPRNVDGQPWIRWNQAERLHKVFDSLSEKTEERRSREDIVTEQALGSLKKRLEPCCGITRFVNKFVAHPSDPSNRLDKIPQRERTMYLREGKIIIDLQRIHDCHAAICHVAAFLAIRVLGLSDGIFQPPITMDVLAHLDKPWSRKTDHTRLCDVLRKHREDIQKWTRPDVG